MTMVDKRKIAIIGAGISGLSIAQEMSDCFDIDVYEKEVIPGGLIRCRLVNGSLFHLCGGHVFNSKRRDVVDWFWNHFNQSDFHKIVRNSVIVMEDSQIIPYPIENHIAYFPESIQRTIINELLSLGMRNSHSTSFDDYLCNSFGKQLYSLYFKPYNEKIWGRDISGIPMSWLDGKLPKSDIANIIYNNINKVEEREFVHSSFWYENSNGSQFIANKLSEGLNIKYGTDVQTMVYDSGVWTIGGIKYDSVVYTGNVKDLPILLKGVNVDMFDTCLRKLDYHGTTSVFCEIDSNPYSWVYLPSPKYRCHRIICTGNFAKINNGLKTRISGTVEFTGPMEKSEILSNLKLAPLHPTYLTHHYTQYSYPIQTANTREMIACLKSHLAKCHFYLIGRFAEWEYYNMDVAIGAALDLRNRLRIELYR